MTDMTGKTVVITGATSGLGRESAKEIARMGATVALTGRNKQKLEQTVEDITKQVPGAKLDTFVCDQSQMSQVRELAEQLLAKYPKIDVLMNNAGISCQKPQITSEGLEHVFATNHLSSFLLTNLLLERLIQSDARVVNVSSSMHKHVKLDFDNLQSLKGFNWDNSYSRSKLMNLMFTFELARKCQGKTITVNAIHPGLVKTSIGRNDTLMLKIGKVMADLFAMPVEKGALTQ
ncbi:MAG: SDR family NAD(P)-dependent oxidoreductase, partial [Caldiserica bacterium]|nr:SDR family NAD(P)-dependent oxidoreductase [Caldisericota bacterium]